MDRYQMYAQRRRQMIECDYYSRKPFAHQPPAETRTRYTDPPKQNVLNCPNPESSFPKTLQ